MWFAQPALWQLQAEQQPLFVLTIFWALCPMLVCDVTIAGCSSGYSRRKGVLLWHKGWCTP